MKKLEFMDKYWICEDCAAERGWKLVPWPVTVSSGYCSHCESEEEKMMIPVVDFKKHPKDKPVWD